MTLALRYSMLVAGVAGLVFAAGFFLQLDWATRYWPWPSSRLSNIFLASILAASAVPVLWIALAKETAAIAGGALDFCLMYTGMAAFSLLTYAREPTRGPILVFGIACALLATLCAALAVWSRRFAYLDTRPTPALVRWSFAAFFVLLVCIGGALVLKAANIFPWRLGPEQSVLYGWIFLGAACYFLYAVIVPRWANAQGQLLGFLAYDAVLIGPFILHFRTVEPGLWINLVVDLGELGYSAVLAVYFLFLNRATRFEVTAT